jgi:hypothetical protein
MRLVSSLVLAASLALPAQSVTAEVVFGKTKQVVASGTKSEQREVNFVVTDDKQLVIREKSKKATPLVAIRFDEITALNYERSKHPRAKTAIFISPMFLMSSGKKHWLTIQYTKAEKADFVLLRLDKDEYQRVLATLEAQTGRKIEKDVDPS